MESGRSGRQTLQVAEARLDEVGRIVAADGPWRAAAVAADSPDLLLCRGAVGDHYLQACHAAGGIGPAVATRISDLLSDCGESTSFDYQTTDGAWRLSITCPPDATPGVRLRHERLGDSDERVSNSRMRCLAAMANELLFIEDEATFLRRAVELPREQFGLARCGLMLLRGEVMHGSFGTDFDGQTIDERSHRIAISDSHWPAHLRSRTGHEASWDLQIGVRCYWTPAGVVMGPTGWIGLTPVTSSTEVLGILSNDAGLGDDPYDPLVQEVLAVYAALLGGLLAQRRAEQGERRSHRRLALLHEVSAAVADCDSPQELARRLGAVLRQELPIDAFFIQAYDYQTRQARTLAQFDTIEGEYRQLDHDPPVVPLVNSSIFERLTREPGPVLIDRERDDALAPRLVPFGHRERPSASLAFLPIIRGQRLEGVMSAQSYSPEAYDDEAVDLLGAVAAQIAPVLEGVRLRAELARQTEELRVREQRYRAILAASSGVVYELEERTGRYRFVGEGVEHLTGYAPEELTAERFEAMIIEALPIPVTETPLLKAARRLVAADRMVVTRRNLRLRTQDGRTLWIADTAVRITDDSGAPRPTLGLLRDVTASREAEHHRLELAALIEQMQDAVLLTDRELAVQYVNPAFEQLTGFAAGEVLGRSAIELVRSGDAESPLQLAAIEQAMADGRNWRGRLLRPRKDGTVVPVDAAVAAVRDSDGRVIAVLGVERDLRPLEAIEERLRQTARMEAVGRLASGLAHDFNNLLTTILGYADMLAESLPQDSAAASDAAEIVVAAHRATNLTQQLLALSRQRRGEARAIDLVEFVTSLRPIVEAVAVGGIVVEMRLNDLPRKVWADPAQLERAVLDLVGWSIEAMQSRGALTFATHSAVPPQGLLAGSSASDPRERVWLCLEVADNGPGLDEQQRERIFEPFLSYAGPTVTTRLGLATAYSLVTQNHGLLECLSWPGQGTRFRIWLPPYLP